MGRRMKRRKEGGKMSYPWKVSKGSDLWLRWDVCSEYIIVRFSSLIQSRPAPCIQAEA